MVSNIKSLFVTVISSSVAAIMFYQYNIITIIVHSHRYVYSYISLVSMSIHELLRTMIRT